MQQKKLSEPTVFLNAVQRFLLLIVPALRDLDVMQSSSFIQEYGMRRKRRRPWETQKKTWINPDVIVAF